MTKLCGGELNLVFAPYSDNWRKNRKLFQQNFRQSIIDRFHPDQYAMVHEFLRQLINTPDKFMQHILALSQRTIFSTLYGLDVDLDDPIAKTMIKSNHTFQRILLGAFPAVERYPWLRFMPSWFPGCEFKRVAEQCLRDMNKADTVPFEMAVENLKTGRGSSPIAELAIKAEGNSEEITAIKAMGTTSLAAAADTTGATLSSFTLAMILHPDVQLKGQEEIDRVLGRDRLPTFDDRLSLPYVEAIYREVLRLNPPLPLGMGHGSTEDDVYLGYHIPKGCNVIANIWAMNRDPDVYSQPDDFLPERFLDDSTGPFTSLNSINAYGFGRRVCVGKYMADNTVWLTIASPKDMEGNDIDIPEEYTNGFTREPKPFQCTITPRTPFAKTLILATAS
ncbi:cytochrome P450 [Gymnopus androsaceus JB14]|uniref:Cytochrome P450 n=1 Tax=Gymnopus androsaceus JB14 TaxID=1447944 RepID=A0A6A4HIH7_9AGAR|nr:cytochrome P450 [Gymnopus androsaceus JB14]